MPPLRGIDRGIDGKMLCELEQIGHGGQIVIVDASYHIPFTARSVNYLGLTSAQALNGILGLVPVDAIRQADGSEGTPYVLCMNPDLPTKTCEALQSFEKVIANQTSILELKGVPRLANSESKDEIEKAGFYTLANNSDMPTLFVRTRDVLAYSCVLFAVGHSQE